MSVTMTIELLSLSLSPQVNVASRMDSTGVPGYTQCTQEVVDSLQGSHFEFKCRGQIKVKGKGDMVTYFLCDSKPSNEGEAGHHQLRHPNYHENANYQGSVINKEIYMKKKNFGNYLEDKPATSNAGNFYNGVNLTENLNYVKREYDNYNKININNHYNINNYNINGQGQHYQQPQTLQQQQYNIRENFNIIENPSDKRPRNNYIEEPSNYSNHYNIVHARNEHHHENEPLLTTNSNVMPKVLYRAEQTNKYEPPQYVGVPFQRTIQPMHDARYQRHYQQPQSLQLQAQQMKKQTNSAPLRYHNGGNSSQQQQQQNVEAYLKPLPKIPVTNEFNESREMSSTDDLSQSDRRQSISVDSSSDESYSKTTDDFDQSNLKLNMPKIDHKQHLNYPLQSLDDHRIIPALKDLQDYEISSTTDHTISTLPNKGESCNSFEFHHDKRELRNLPVLISDYHHRRLIKRFCLFLFSSSLVL